MKDRKQLQRFLGLINYASGFIPKLAKMREPLQVKLRGDIPWT